MGLGTSSLSRFRWLIICGVACVLVATLWRIPAVARAASILDAPVAMPQSCAGSSLGAHDAALYVMARSQETGAQLSINRTEGPPGTQLILSGNGWPAGAVVSIDLIGEGPNGHPFIGVAGIAHATAASDGSFRTGTFAAPYQHSCVGGSYGEPDTIVHYSAHTSDRSVAAEASFHYLAAPVVQTLSGGVYGQTATPGAQITLVGEHWEADVEVTLTAATIAQPFLKPGQDNQPMPRNQDTMQVQTDATGAFRENMRMPADLAPRTGYVISATSSGPRFGTLTSPGMLLLTLPAKMPTLTLDSSAGTAGSDVQMAGAHWVPGDVVTLEYCRGESHTFGAHAQDLRCDPFTTQQLGEARVGADGHFQVRVTLPPAAQLGVVTIQARVANDIFGLMIYAQAQTFTIVRQATTGTTVHPLPASMEEIGAASVLGVLLLALAVWRWVWPGRGTRGRRKAAGIE